MEILKEIFELLLKYLSKFLVIKNYNQPIPKDLIKEKNPINAMKEIYNNWGANWNKVNIMGIRNDTNPGEWNDFIIINIGNKIWKYEATVDPSKHYTDKPLNKDGAAHLCLGYHPNIWIRGKHRGYPALVQKGGGAPCKIWRDTNKDFINNDGIIETKLSAINMHHGWSIRGKIGVHGAGCQVVRNRKKFENFMENIKTVRIKRFDYLLIPIQNCPVILRNMDFGLCENLQNVI